MQNALVVTAHPNPNSFNSALGKQAIAQLHLQQWQVNQSELYQMNFDPRLSPHDYPTLPANQDESIMQQQSSARDNQLFSADIVNEQSKLEQADLLILQFPIWWGSYPAILKGWIERIDTLVQYRLHLQSAID
jgi:putative NADPH-quinone reductase